MKNKHRFLFYATVFILSFFFFQQTGFAQTVHIEADDLLVRSGAGTTYEQIGHVNQGESYPLIDENDEWVAIDYEGQTGWISKQFATIVNQENTTEQAVTNNEADNSETPEPDQPNTDTFNIPVDRVNLRSEATTQSDIQAVLTQGETVTIIEHVNDHWLEVEWQDTNGFIPSWLIEHDYNHTSGLSSSLKDKVIVIDPGHGGHDIGATSVTDNYEKQYALYTARTLKNQLELLDAKVYLTRDDDFYYALTPRSILANYLSADAFLSIHYNSEPQYPSANGMNTYYLWETDQDLAEHVHQGLIDETGANDRGIESGNFLVLRLSKQPGILLELGFLSNDNEEKMIQSPDYQDKISKGIINGLEGYFSNH
ncbi:N-acetylmuramoyl-L-alanine amidase [Amphibacillus sp. Q70]|uniref:N-acetylmuramoyl-L-alanine amidase n=1 Tax=Amphibacillus sp. Q70 TaxID=3453416 RepID=UPI003F826BE4